MTKAECIERYGLEWYERCKARTKARQKERYHNEPEFREVHKARHRAYSKARYRNDSTFREYMKADKRAYGKVYNKARYVEDGRIDLIENYELALADEFKDWEIHHRLEIHDDYINTAEHLKLMNLYFNRPPAELIWLRCSEHMRMHGKALAKAQ